MAVVGSHSIYLTLFVVYLVGINKYLLEDQFGFIWNLLWIYLDLELSGCRRETVDLIGVYLVIGK